MRAPVPGGSSRSSTPLAEIANRQPQSKGLRLIKADGTCWVLAEAQPRQGYGTTSPAGLQLGWRRARLKQCNVPREGPKTDNRKLKTDNRKLKACACGKMTRFDILTLFPKLCEGAFSESILKKAQENQLIQVRCLNIREWATDKHHVTDEPPYGGGPGMVLKPEPIFAAVEAIRTPESHTILLGPGGKRFNQAKAHELSQKQHLIFVCGHYEGVDHRVTEHLVNEEISLGDYVLTNGAIAAAVVVDAIARLIPGVLGEGTSPDDESFSRGLLEYPHYTRPHDFRGWKVPEILLSGDHAAIRQWREAMARKKTEQQRPDLLRGDS